MAELRKVLVLLVMFAVIVSPDWTQSQSAGDPIEVFWSYKSTGSFEATVGPESPLHGNSSELSLSLPFSNGHRRKGKVDTVVSVFERSELSRMKRSLTSKEDLGRIVFGGSVRIVDGYTWSEDLLFSNTSFYRDLEAQVILMVLTPASNLYHYCGDTLMF
ncbi:uncharacterized protein LOC112560457 [Pomacea canaliculata]|uniref:uncharacterized protein LOC112560457 n=1 Tax=Pomacea canaliculata TaxID=400727 RepID=UPI000D7321FA|nr:uncharacterized protein LOC112560457 [Pomacea canaliculata]